MSAVNHRWARTGALVAAGAFIGALVVPAVVSGQGDPDVKLGPATPVAIVAPQPVPVTGAVDANVSGDIGVSNAAGSVLTVDQIPAQEPYSVLLQAQENDRALDIDETIDVPDGKAFVSTHAYVRANLTVPGELGNGRLQVLASTGGGGFSNVLAAPLPCAPETSVTLGGAGCVGASELPWTFQDGDLALFTFFASDTGVLTVGLTLVGYLVDA
jgi:hypothetical protein